MNTYQIVLYGLNFGTLLFCFILVYYALKLGRITTGSDVWAYFSYGLLGWVAGFVILGSAVILEYEALALLPSFICLTLGSLCMLLSFFNLTNLTEVNRS